MFTRTAVSVALLLIGYTLPDSNPVDRRIVDTVIVGEAESEWAHGYAGYDVTAGVANDTTFRQARGWMRYSMTTFDDTEVTVALTFASGSAQTNPFDLVVEDSLIATRTLAVTTTGVKVVEIQVPFSVTKGRTNIAVTVRARGGPTPALREMRILQDHHEFSLAHVPASAVHTKAAVVSLLSSRSHNPFGVAR